MKILFTGASSFTGFWFAWELAAAGHQVYATFQGDRQSYSAVRERRIAQLTEHIEPVWNCSFGDDRFMDLFGGGRAWDLLCHHAADVTNYRSADFDVLAAVSSNTNRVRQVVSALKRSDSPRILFTGSVFEPGEGAGSEGLPAFSPYGLSKSLSWQLFHYYCSQVGIPCSKFVIPNPFGPFEEARFTAYLINTWKRGEAANVNTPAYVRDNIHVSLLAAAYRSLAEDIEMQYGGRLAPSGYIENQGQFALRVAMEMRRRTALTCDVKLAEQKEFLEPRIRINTDVFSEDCWEESAAWDHFCQYYMEEE